MIARKPREEEQEFEQVYDYPSLVSSFLYCFSFSFKNKIEF
jgi:hypothetical protein